MWVVLGLLVSHPLGGGVALPLLARLYIRKKNLGAARAADWPPFATKRTMVVGLVRWRHGWLRLWGKAVWVAADGADTQGPVLKPLRQLGVTVVSRLRRNAALCSVPGPRARAPTGVWHGPGGTGQAGRPPRRVEHRHIYRVREDRAEAVQDVRGHVAPGRVCDPGGAGERTPRVGRVLRHRHGPTAAHVLERVADRFALETCFRDLKPTAGAGRQQVRRLPADIGSFHLCLWSFTMTEVWAWDRKAEELVGHRSASPWDDPNRRPSHADKRRAWQHQLLAEEIQAVVGDQQDPARICALARRCLDLAA
ncbi:hypothetical protein GobsT_73080 [Gemmata obscuriglobus]|nr:hypothetical protein GobsT_73080 [Gemmata obscuriglobus]VTS11809.1 Uncharacterized protein OS=Singulisphaera acidiphila (strain ATCC BAA-1392 / DSM 18658 / VKM B-2454 / MOB10) GN=Sinac_2157 PE=4 SV=1 [Gemmata obscuriglobus UQM 2246]